MQHSSWCGETPLCDCCCDCYGDVHEDTGNVDGKQMSGENTRGQTGVGSAVETANPGNTSVLDRSQSISYDSSDPDGHAGGGLDFGPGFKTNSMPNLRFDGENVAVESGTNETLQFEKKGDSYEACYFVRDQLSVNGDGDFELTGEDGQKHVFDPQTGLLETTTFNDGTRDYLTVREYDNRGIVTHVSTYHDSASTPNLIGKSIRHFDTRGRQFKVEIHPDDGGDPLVGKTWYDPAGNVVRQEGAGSESFVVTGYTDKTYPVGDAGTTSEDRVLATDNFYDGDGQLVRQVHAGTKSGATVSQYDAVGRTTQAVFGYEDGSTVTDLLRAELISYAIAELIS